MAVCGYARVSTDGQSLSAQLAELKAANCAKIFQEKISGARSDRKQLTRLMGVGFRQAPTYRCTHGFHLQSYNSALEISERRTKRHVLL